MLSLMRRPCPLQPVLEDVFGEPDDGTRTWEAEVTIGRCGWTRGKPGIKCTTPKPQPRPLPSRYCDIRIPMNRLTSSHGAQYGFLRFKSVRYVYLEGLLANVLRPQVRKAVRPWAPRKSLQPGTVLILLAGRFRGKRVILVKALDQGVLLVTGPFKINGVPLRRVNSRYVIATSYKVDVSGLDQKKVEEISQPKYFTADKAKEKAGEDAFFKQGEKPQVRKHLMRGGRETSTSHDR